LSNSPELPVGRASLKTLKNSLDSIHKRIWRALAGGLGVRKREISETACEELASHVNMKKLAVGFSLFAAALMAGEWKGVIADSKCGAAHMDGSEKSIACVKTCIKAGAKPVFVSEGKVYKIADATKVKTEDLGHKVVVSGSMEGDTISIDSVKMDH
jgi:hypothetical protein